MATSGVIETQIHDGADLLGMDAWGKLEWTRTSVSHLKNTSTISCTVQLKENWGLYPYGAGTSYCKVKSVINGHTAEHVAVWTRPGPGNYARIVTFNETISHNSDGSKTATAYVYISKKSYASMTDAEKDDLSDSYSRISGSIVLDTITLPASITSATDFNDEGNPSISYYNVSGNAVTALEACISFTGSVDDIPYRAVSKAVNGGYTFNLTDEERKILRQRITTGNSTTVRFYLRTTIGSENFWSYTTKTLTLVNYTPVLSPTVTDTNPATAMLTGDINKLIRYHSNASVTFGAEARKEATIARKTLTNGSQFFEITDANQDNVVVNKIDDNVFTLTMADSRGYSTSQQVHFKGDNFIPYFGVTCALAIRLNLDKTIDMTVKGKYFDDSFGALHNELIVETRHSEDGGEWSEWEAITPLVSDISNGSYTLNATISGYDPSGTYDFQCRAVDKLTTAESAVETVTLEPIFDWGRNDFNFNVPLTIEGDPLDDFVIETGIEVMGTNGTWYWRKWRNGRAECYGCRNYGNMAVTTAWGVLYRSEPFAQELPSGLFVDTPEVMDITLRGTGNYGGWIARHEESAANSSDTGSFIVVRPASATLQQAYISFNIVGRWK